MISWEFVAEGCALFSGIALVWPALRLNRKMRKAEAQQKRAQTGRSKWANEFRRGIARAYTDPQWSLLDEVLTIAGVLLLTLSSAIKLTILWNTPAKEHVPSPAVVIPPAQSSQRSSSLALSGSPILTKHL